MQQPLSVQLEALNLWHASLVAGLRTFKAQFRSAGCGVIASADREVFQVGIDRLHYEGPLRIQVCVARFL